MIKTHLKIAWRHLCRHKGYSAINIFGLAVGMASALLIYLYVWHELTYDTYHPDSDRIYRISTLKNDQGIAGCSENVSDYLRTNFPEVEQVFRIQPLRPAAVRVEDRAIQVENITYADNDLLHMFSMPVIAGDVQTALVRPMTAVLTRTLANQLFGTGQAVGKSVRIDTLRYEITAVVEDSPSNTHLKFNMILSWATFDEVDREVWRHSWDGGFFKTYVRLADGTDPKQFEARIAPLIEQKIGDELRQRGQRASLFLQPVTDIHLHSNLRWEAEAPGNITYVLVLALVGAMILLIASLNFMNLATARSTARASEVGLRKVVGATRGHLVGQFMGEMVMTAALALLLALLLVELALPSFNHLAGTRYGFLDLLTGPGLAGMFATVIVIGVLAGLYPAFVLSSLRPIWVLKGTSTKGKGGVLFRRMIVTLQFVIAIVLVVGSLTVYSQITFMRKQALGFEPRQKLVLEMPNGAVTPDNFEAVKSEFAGHSLVKGATFSTSVPGRWNYQWRTYPAGEEATNSHVINWYGVDQNFIDLYGVEITSGRKFGPDGQGVILNEAAVATFGWQSPEVALSKSVLRAGRHVVGIARNFHIRGLQVAVEPMGLFVMSEDFRYLTLNVSAGDASAVMDFVREKFAARFADQPFNFFFLDEDFDKQYRVETKLGTIFGLFTALGIAVAALGLFGLASYTAEQRTKEIGVRKVLGASETSIVGLLIREVLVVVSVAVVLAWPIAYAAGNRWLEQFAFRTSVGWLTLLLAAGGTLAIAVLSVGYQALRAAQTNPIVSLKYE